jgi:hypothetical protein
MKLAHNITIEVFVKANDSLAEAYAAIDALAPVPVKELHDVAFRWHPERERTKVYELPKKGVSLWEHPTPGEEGTITVLHYRFTKQRDTQAFLERLRTLSTSEREEFLKDLDEHLDSKGRLVLKFDREALAVGKLSFARIGGVVARINLAAYPKNEETCEELALLVFR